MPEIQKYQKKNGDICWKFQVYVGINPKTGKQSMTTRSGFRTKREATIALKRIEHAVATNQYFKDKKTDPVKSFEEVSKEWLIEYQETVAPSTYLKTSRDIQNHFSDLFNFKIDQITRQDIKDLSTDWANFKKGKLWLSTLSRIFKFAQREEYIKDNPCDHIKISKPKPKTKSKKFYELSEVKLFLKAMTEYSHPFATAFFRLAIFCGMRKGEILALDFSDFTHDSVTISKSVSRRAKDSSTELYIKSMPKNESSIRTISVDKETLESVEILKDFSPNHRLFNSRHGGILTTARPREWSRQIARIANLEPIPIHGFRHTHASLLFEAGATIKEVQDRLGHSKIATTMDIYTHVTESSKDKLAEKFNNFIAT